MKKMAVLRGRVESIREEGNRGENMRKNVEKNIMVILFFFSNMGVVLPNR